MTLFILLALICEGGCLAVSVEEVCGSQQAKTNTNTRSCFHLSFIQWGTPQRLLHSTCSLCVCVHAARRLSGDILLRLTSERLRSGADRIQLCLHPEKKKTTTKNLHIYNQRLEIFVIYITSTYIPVWARCACWVVIEPV